MLHSKMDQAPYLTWLRESVMSMSGQNLAARVSQHL
jgi:hypothetical protein